jgi:hypothetical protein
MQRAAMGTLIVGSLAKDLVTVSNAADALVAALQGRDRKTSASGPRKRPHA